MRSILSLQLSLVSSILVVQVDLELLDSLILDLEPAVFALPVLVFGSKLLLKWRGRFLNQKGMVSGCCISPPSLSVSCRARHRISIAVLETPSPPLFPALPLSFS